jgi:hypothetical protein
LGYSHPIIIPVEEDDLESYASKIGKGEMLAVLKRGHSGWSNHLITPNTPHPVDKIKAALDTQRQTWGVSGHGFDQPRWFCQPYMPLLIHLGELRTYLVNGVIYYTVATTPNISDPHLLEMASGKFTRPLSLFKCVAKVLEFGI